MSYDCMIIGGGLAGITCGIKCAQEGLRTVIISNGMNALHFSSGSIDLMGYGPDKKIIEQPLDFLKTFTEENREHPYAKVGINGIEEALDFFVEELGQESLHLYRNGKNNHFHITILGTKKPTYLSQASVFNERLQEALQKKVKIAVLNFQGFRDYFARLTVGQLKKQSVMKNAEITRGLINLPFYTNTERNPHEYRSIDLARIFDTERYLPRIAKQISEAAGDADIVSLPAFIGINNFNYIHGKLEEMTGKLIYEAPALPPSILGMRIDNALRSRFAELGGEFSAGDKVTGSVITDGMVENVHTQNYGDTMHSARYYVLSTGSFFSGGLNSEFNRLEEPIFNLKLFGNDERNEWYSPEFFDQKSHPFLEYGVETNASLNPGDSDGKTIRNLFCVGSILGKYNPIREGSGGGVAIATGYYAARQIVNRIKKSND